MCLTSCLRPLICLLGLFGLAVSQSAAAVAAAAIEIQSGTHILDSEDPARTEFGALIYLSGITMRSDHEAFGGLSGLQISQDGRHLLAVSDKGNWLAAELVYDKQRLKGLRGATISPLLGRDGRALMGRANIDAEAITLEQPGNLAGPAYVSFEGAHRISLYREGVAARPAPEPMTLAMPRELMQAPANKGLEALARRADGVLVALTEEWLDAAGNHIGWLLGGAKTEKLFLRRERDFSPTDLAFLPDGDLLILERRYTVMGGPGMQIRRIKADRLIPDAVLDGEVLINLTARYGIDNFEGLAVRTDTGGDSIIYLMSDNNFSSRQKNLLLMFKLKQKP